MPPTIIQDNQQWTEVTPRPHTTMCHSNDNNLISINEDSCRQNNQFDCLSTPDEDEERLVYSTSTAQPSDILAAKLTQPSDHYSTSTTHPSDFYTTSQLLLQQTAQPSDILAANLTQPCDHYSTSTTHPSDFYTTSQSSDILAAKPTQLSDLYSASIAKPSDFYTTSQPSDPRLQTKHYWATWCFNCEQSNCYPKVCKQTLNYQTISNNKRARTIEVKRNK